MTLEHDTQVDPKRARLEAVERALAAGLVGTSGAPTLRADGRPSRVARTGGVVVRDGALPQLQSMVVVSPSVKATRLIEIVYATSAAIAVSHAGKLRPLRLQFDTRERGPSPDWIEVRVSKAGMTVEAVPDKAIEIARVEELAAAIEQARKTRRIDASVPVDVLVEAETDSQRLVDVLVALDVAGVAAVGAGTMPPTDELSRRGRRMPAVRIGRPLADGDLDKALIHQTVEASQSKLLTCYTTALATAAELSGTVTSQFFIKPSGKVATASATGLDSAVATCVADVVKTLEFPKPKGRGGVQVNYRFEFVP